MLATYAMMLRDTFESRIVDVDPPISGRPANCAFGKTKGRSLAERDAFPLGRMRDWRPALPAKVKVLARFLHKRRSSHYMHFA
jgi:hypothetical protein